MSATTHILNATSITRADQTLLGGNLIASSLGYSGALLQLRSDRAREMQETLPNGVGVFRQKSDQDGVYEVSRLTGDRLLSLKLEPTRENFTNIQEMPRDHWLLARPRATDEKDLNGAIYDSRGRLVNRVHLGDAVEDVQVTDKGNIWVSYFDEGIFGDFKLSRCGVVKLNAMGEVLLRYSDIEPESTLADCYAMNVASDDEVCLCYYTDFPVVHLRDGKVFERVDDLPLQGLSALAFHGDWVLAGGSYDSKASLRLINRETQADYAVHLQTAAGQIILPIEFFARGSVMCAVADEFYAVDLKTSPLPRGGAR